MIDMAIFSGRYQVTAVVSAWRAPSNPARLAGRRKSNSRGFSLRRATIVRPQFRNRRPRFQGRHGADSTAERTRDPHASTGIGRGLQLY
jgi:hypothetical protein